ncbi:NUDIX hydrolase [Pseudoalteromonas denitrificans]|jgi:ADP-ribose pyrophosphatase YjhB (NUDIX family)|uniref:NUDIX domain-containing protein n=1 Tax=Pseudoalteromonas denitrificans DSM 6059 TaxID=1123010 RepID=A0A1I1ELE7_9GAMM|nr:NUDIX hydrolase [Pseudoalteromonas denitrificans]SFB87905.1 NUDIX domain-containing protein [Pseudoalteromonas denitrificans DSM 6059]
MHLLKSTTHCDIKTLSGKIFQRKAARGIILKGENILMVYTARYHDYTLPGGGIDDGEDIKMGLIRELNEETGAKNIKKIKDFGLYEEFRPWYKSDYDIVHMLSYCFTCTIDDELGETQLEDYEIKNGMKPVWISIFDAIAHNENTMAHSDKKGMSIERETFLLKKIAEQVLVKAESERAL